MQKRRLGNTSLELTVLGFGSWAIGGGDWKFGWGDQDEREAIDAIVTAVRSGINWIDTAAVYGGGRSEELVGKALKELSVSQRPLIATKCGRVMRSPEVIDKVLKRESVLAECEASLRRLGVDCIDLYQLHWPEPDEDIEEGWSALVDLKKQGKVREIGVSNHSVSQMQRLQAIHPLASLQPPYSLIVPEIESEILPFCHAHHIGVVVYSPMYKGLLSGKFTRQRAIDLPASDHRSRDPRFQPPQVDHHLELVEQLRPIAARHGGSVAELAIAWVLRRPEVTSAIVGSRRPSQVAQTIAAAEWKLDTADLEAIDRALGNHRQALLGA
jgi:aryl-alcohol dehydrogenase-like predicted oxidoreductase